MRCVCAYLVSCGFLGLIANAQNSTDSSNSNDYSKAFITAGVLTGGLIISLIIAKIVDHCYDRATLRDDASDISEHTRNLIRARLAVMQFRRKEPKKKPVTDKAKQRRFLRIWSAKARARSVSLKNAKILDTTNKDNTEDLINVEEIPPREEFPDSVPYDRESSLPKVTFVTETDVCQENKPERNNDKLDLESNKDKTAISLFQTNNATKPITPIISVTDHDSTIADNSKKESPRQKLTKNIPLKSRPKTASVTEKDKTLPSRSEKGKETLNLKLDTVKKAEVITTPVVAQEKVKETPINKPSSQGRSSPTKNVTTASQNAPNSGLTSPRKPVHPTPAKLPNSGRSSSAKAASVTPTKFLNAELSSSAKCKNSASDTSPCSPIKFTFTSPDKTSNPATKSAIIAPQELQEIPNSTTSVVSRSEHADNDKSKCEKSLQRKSVHFRGDSVADTGKVKKSKSS